MIPFFPQRSLSHLLILICVIIASLGFIFPELIGRYGMSGQYYRSGDYLSLLVQIILFQFFHGSILHLLANSYFLYIAWPDVEARMSWDRYTWLFITSTLFVAIALLIFAPDSLTIGISGFLWRYSPTSGSTSIRLVIRWHDRSLRCSPSTSE